MRWFERLRRLLDYGPLLAGLVPTLIVLLAAAVVLAHEDGASPVTMPVPAYRQG